VRVSRAAAAGRAAGVRAGRAPARRAWATIADFLAQALRQAAPVERDLGQLLDVAQVIALVLRAEAERDALAPGARGAADAVDVLLGDVGQLEVDHVADARDVDPARGDVGRDEDLGAAVLELVERAFALRLALVAVDRVGGNAALGELLHHAVGAVLGAGEDQHASISPD
jgi:hypothetical protein